MKKVFLTAFVLLSLVFVSKAQTHTIGESFGGGIVIDVSADGLHGLIAETIDQGKCRQAEAAALIADTANHSLAGKAFTDWRLPNPGEMRKLFDNRGKVKGFTNNLYWCSNVLESERGKMGSLVQFTQVFSNRLQFSSINKPSMMQAAIRSVRSF